jgi:hypothetical protein
MMIRGASSFWVPVAVCTSSLPRPLRVAAPLMAVTPYLRNSDSTPLASFSEKPRLREMTLVQS